jgi:hypothetical protein
VHTYHHHHQGLPQPQGLHVAQPDDVVIGHQIRSAEGCGSGDQGKIGSLAPSSNPGAVRLQPHPHSHHDWHHTSKSSSTSSLMLSTTGSGKQPVDSSQETGHVVASTQQIQGHSQGYPPMTATSAAVNVVAVNGPGQSGVAVSHG